MIGGLNPVSLLATSMFGPMGGIVSQLATQMMSAIGQQLIQNMGNNLGLPQSAINSAQDAFAGGSLGAFGGQQTPNIFDTIDQLGQATGASPAEIGDAQSQVQDIMHDFISNAGESDEFKDAKASGGRGGGWLMAMAKALGAELDRMGAEMEQRASSLTGDDPGASAEFGVVSQQFSMLMNATNNAIKTIGEAMANTARKQ